MTDLGCHGWRWRALVAEAIVRLLIYRIAISAIPFRLWRSHLGPAWNGGSSSHAPGRTALRLARAVDRAASRVPFEFKCLPRAMALHAMLLRHNLPSVLVIGVLGASRRGSLNDLHAWVRSGSDVIIGGTGEAFYPLASFGISI